MDEYTPTTDGVRDLYADHAFSPKAYDRMRGDFDRWLNGVRAEAWDEGLKWRRPYANEAYLKENPYRYPEKYRSPGAEAD